MGASLTIAEANREENWFEVWLILRDLRMTVFGQKSRRSGQYRNRETNASRGRYRTQSHARNARPFIASFGRNLGEARGEVALQKTAWLISMDAGDSNLFDPIHTAPPLTE